MTTRPSNPGTATRDPDSFRFACRVIPRAKRTGWGEPRGGVPVIRVAAPPVDDKANAALKRFLGAEFDTPPSHVHIERGGNSRSKIIRIDHARRIPPQLGPAPHDAG